LITALIFASFTGFTRSYVVPTGSRPAGMGNAFVSQHNEFSVFQNQAGLAAFDKTSVSFFFENKFFVNQMSVRAGVLTFPTTRGNFAIQYNSFGPPAYRESNAGIAYSTFLSEKLSAGLQLNYFGTRLPEDNVTAMSVGFEVGAIYQLSERTFMGVHLANPYSSQVNTTMYSDVIPWRVKIGGHTQFTDDFVFSYETEMMEGYLPFLKVGAQWEAAEGFFIRGGVNTAPVRFYTGFGYETKFFTFDTSFSYHQYLGYVPSVSLIFSFF